MRLLPHRYPFLLVDRIVSCVPERTVDAYKCVSINEPFFQGHFPGLPVMPGVLIVESMAQAGAFLVLSSYVSIHSRLPSSTDAAAEDTGRVDRLLPEGEGSRERGAGPAGPQAGIAPQGEGADRKGNFDAAQFLGDSIFLFTGIEHVRFRKPVLPGDRLDLHCELLRRKMRLWKMRGIARVDGALAAEAELTAAVVPREDV
jgi:3-hydroxyacyl-[acyl-carrier-protein] dehydratase